MKNYSFINTTLHVNGVEIAGWQEGDDSITLNRIEDSAAHIVDAHSGELIVSHFATRAGSVSFNLDQTSDSNTYLTGLMSLQETSVTGFTPVFIQLKDLDGGDIGNGSYGYLTKPADMVRGKNTNTATWNINVEKLDMIYG